jgi:hypothetical protein
MEISRMNYWFTSILIVLICLLTLIEPAYPGSTQTNTSGSNTAIEGGYTSTATARILNDFGMKVAAVAILCQDERVFESMIQAGTPCPIDGKIGKEAKQLWGKYDHERPDYNTYVKRMEDRRKADEEEQKRITAELEAMDKAKAEEDRKKANAEKMKNWKHPR